MLPEFVPEGKGAALPGPDGIDAAALERRVIKDAGDIIAALNLLERKAVTDFAGVFADQRRGFYTQESGDGREFLLSHKNIAAAAVAAFSPAGAAGIRIESKREAVFFNESCFMIGFHIAWDA